MSFFSKFIKSDQDITKSQRFDPTKGAEMSDDDPELIAALHSDEAKPVQQKLPHSDTCPYCGVILDKPFTRKRKCPECEEVVYVRTTQSLYPSSALTKEQLNNAEFYETMRTMIDVTEDDYNKHAASLKKKWGLNEINTYDVLWSMFNDLELYTRGIDKSLDSDWRAISLYRTKSVVDEAAAFYQGRRGFDPTDYLKTAKSYHIKVAKLEPSIKGLTVISYNCCEPCKKFHNKTFSTDFLESNPVLPIPACTNPLEEGSRFTFCNCQYDSYWDFD